MTNAVNPVRSEESGLALLTAQCDTGSYDHENNDATAHRDCSAVLGRLSAVQRGAGFGVENKQRDADTDLRLAEHGWRVLRVWAHDEPEHVVDQIRDLVHQDHCNA